MDDAPSEDERATLASAIERAERVVADLERRQRDLEADPPGHLSADQRLAGQNALVAALSAARRMLNALKDARGDHA